jgi:hypothetical protein
VPTLNKTATIERLPAMEQRLGLSLESLFASYDGEIEYLTVNFDVLAAAGELDDDVEIIVSAFNVAGQMIGTTTQYLDADDFFGMDTQSAIIQLHEAPARIRVYPKRG